MNPIIYEITKNIKKVFNKVDINVYIIGSYANYTERNDSDINLHLFSEDYDLDKQKKMMMLLKLSLSDEINNKLNLKTFDIKSLTAKQPSLSRVEHNCRLYNGAYNVHNDFGLDPTKIRTPHPDLMDLCNQISLHNKWLFIFDFLEKNSINFLEFGVKNAPAFIKIILNSIFVTKSSSYDMPHSFKDLLEHTEKYAIGIKELCNNLLTNQNEENANALNHHFKSLYITSIIKEYGRDNFPTKDVLDKYERIHSSDRHQLFYRYPKLERTGELETFIPNFYDITKKIHTDNLNRLNELFKTL